MDFISQCSFILRAIIEYIHERKTTPLSSTFFHKLPENILETCFVPATEKCLIACIANPQPVMFHEDITYDFEISYYLPVIECYFSLRKNIHDSADKCIKQWNLKMDKTAAFYYGIEGSKHSDLIDIFYEQMRLCVDNGYHLLVYSNCPNFSSKTKRHFGQDVHVARPNNRNIPSFLAMVKLVSQCAKIFFTTGSASLWMLMYRGSKQGVYQCHSHLHVFYDLARCVFLRSPKDLVTTVVLPTITDRWAAYRLADMFFSSYAQGKEDGRELHLRMFNDSIASEYMRRTKKPEQYTVLANIVREKQIEFIPDWVIHLRGGDVLEDEFGVAKMISTDLEYEMGDVGAIYMRPVHDIIEDFQPSPTDTKLHVCIMTGGSRVHNAPKSLDMASLIADKLQSHAKIAHITIRFFENPDDDFVLMCSVQNFIPSGGGFSDAVSTLRNGYSTVVHRRKVRCPT